MNQTSKTVLAIIITAIVVGGGVYYWQKDALTDTAPRSSPTTTNENANAGAPVTTDQKREQKLRQVTYLVSNEETTKYCNGVDMDDAGYRKTITQERHTNEPIGLTETESVQGVLVAATTGQCQDLMKRLDITVMNGVVSIPPIDEWAGMSIAMCSCKPQVEVNVLQIPNMKQVVWQKCDQDSK